METKKYIFKICSKIRKIVQLSEAKCANIRCFYIAKKDFVAVTQKSVQLSGSYNYPVCNYPETTVLHIQYRANKHCIGNIIIYSTFQASKSKYHRQYSLKFSILLLMFMCIDMYFIHPPQDEFLLICIDFTGHLKYVLI